MSAFPSASVDINRNSAAEVLANQYGDCKDKSTLLNTLLEAEGFHASSVLLNTLFEVEPEVPSPYQFDHMITVVSIEGKNVWLDSTSNISQFGYLPPRLRGKRALVLGTSRPAELVRTVELPPETSYQVGFDASVKGGSTADISLSVELRGDAEFLARTTVLTVPPDYLNSILAAQAKTNPKRVGSLNKYQLMG